MGGTLGLLSLSLCMSPLHPAGGVARILPRCILKRMGIPWFSVGAPRTLHKGVSMMKR
jgi:hypothetical protein